VDTIRGIIIHHTDTPVHFRIMYTLAEMLRIKLIWIIMLITINTSLSISHILNTKADEQKDILTDRLSYTKHTTIKAITM
jgi:hypothetical protein